MLATSTSALPCSAPFGDRPLPSALFCLGAKIRSASAGWGACRSESSLQGLARRSLAPSLAAPAAPDGGSGMQAGQGPGARPVGAYPQQQQQYQQHQGPGQPGAQPGLQPGERAAGSSGSRCSLPLTRRRPPPAAASVPVCSALACVACRCFVPHTRLVPLHMQGWLVATTMAPPRSRGCGHPPQRRDRWRQGWPARCSK